MGFNYLQTDDRDDYFDSIRNDKPTKKRPIYNLLNNDGKIVKSGNNGTLNQYVCKTFGLTARFGKKGRWRDFILDKGFKLEKINVKIDPLEANGFSFETGV